MKNIKALVNLVNAQDLSYNEKGKAEFHRLAKLVAHKIAKDLGFAKETFSIRSNKGGIAVSGEVTLHADNIYISFSQGFTQVSFLFRSCKNQNDYTGGANNYMKWEELLDWNTAMDTFRCVMK